MIGEYRSAIFRIRCRQEEIQSVCFCRDSWTGQYYIGSRSVIAAVLGCLIFSGLASAMIYFLARLDKKESTEEPYPMYGSRKRAPF
jgi:hypothetical protein